MSKERKWGRPFQVKGTIGEARQKHVKECQIPKDCNIWGLRRETRKGYLAKWGHEAGKIDTTRW